MAITALLVSVRVFAAVAVIPGFDSPAMPKGTRVIVGLTLAAMFTTCVSVTPVQYTPPLIALLVDVGLEIVVGAALGLAIAAPLYALRSAGDVIGTSMGLGFAVSVDPNSQSRNTVVARFYGAIAALAFLVADGPRVALQVLANSFRLMPVGGVNFNTLGFFALDLGARFYEVVIRVAAPPVVAVLIAQVVVGLIGRASPALNVFAVGFAVTLSVGGLAIAASWPSSIDVLHQETMESIRAALGALAPGSAP